MPLSFRYSSISRESRECGQRLLDSTRSYEDALVPSGLGAGRLGVLALLARGRHLLRTAYQTADGGSAMEAAIILRALNESVLTLGWFNKDPELAEFVWMLDEIRTRLSHHDEVAKEERNERTRARRRGEPVEPVPPGRSLGLLTRSMVKDLKRLDRVTRARIDRLPRRARRLKRLRISRVSEVPSFRNRSKVAKMPWVYVLAYRFDSNAAAHPSPLAVGQFLEERDGSIRVRATPRGPFPDPYYVGARLMWALLTLAGEHVDQSSFAEQLDDVRAALDGLALRVPSP